MNLLDPSKADEMQKLFRAGIGIRGAASILGVAKNTVSRHYHCGAPLLCPCGSSLMHKGWCGHRVAMSPGRQRFLQKWRPIKLITVLRWRATEDAIADSIARSEALATIDMEARSELLRFYKPAPERVSFESASLVEVEAPTQENSPMHLLKAIEAMPHPARQICETIVDGATLEEARIECGLSIPDLMLWLPRIKVAIGPLLGR